MRVIRPLLHVAISLFLATAALGASIRPTGQSVAGEVIVKIRSGASANDIAGLERAADADKSQRLANLGNGSLWRLHSRSKSTEAVMAALAHNPHVEYVEPNHIVRLVATPNDPSYSNLWGLKNTGQTISGSPGNAGADIDGEPAWDVTTGSASIVVGVVDTGIDYNHPDLAANVWSNPGGKGNAACGAGTHGFNAITNTCDPMDDHDHGTHVSGTIGAVGNNGIGVAGVNWTTSIMGLKFLDWDGYGSIAGAIAVIEFAVQAKIDGVNIRVLSNSWGGGSFSKALLDEINRANEHDILFVAAAGNDSTNNDTLPHYPSNYATPNMISVAASDNRDGRAWFTNIGATTVHLAAPGVSVYSTVLGGYAYFSGTSMATPHVSGVAALLLAKTPALTTAQVKAAILANTDPLPIWQGMTITGGRLNAARVLGGVLPPEFSISANPASRTVTRGGSTTYTVSITPANGFSGAVDLSASTSLTGVTTSFSPATATSTSTLTVTTSASTALGSGVITITGTSGAMTRTTSVNLTTAASVPPAACPSFATPSHFSAGSPTAIAIADFNRDGRGDFAAAWTESNGIGIRLATPSSSFQSTIFYAMGNAPLSVAAGDFNGDGKLDVAAANSGSNNVSVRLGNGDGTFQSLNNYAAGTTPFSVVTGDFNRDGKLDLAVANNGSSNVTILLGQGNGAFQSPVHYGTGSGPFWIAIGDFDRDGPIDLAVAAFNADKVAVLRGNGDGTFQSAVEYAVGNSPSSVAAGDFNRDGRLDLAVSNYRNTNVSILLGNGDATFQAAVNYSTGSRPYSVAAGDVNSDGKLDLVTANSLSDDISLLIGNGNGTFQTATQTVTGYEPNHAALGDLNADGRLDIAVGNVDSNTVSILFNVGSCALNCGTFNTATDFAAGTTPDAVAAGDFNGDGRPDLAVVNTGANNISISLGNGDGTFTAGVSVDAGTSPESIAVADLNRDGKLDLITARPGANEVTILRGNGDGTFQTAAHYAGGNTPRSVAVGDLNGDGRLDLAVAAYGSNSAAVLLATGDTTYAAPVTYGAGTNPESIAIGDLNRDGRLDLAVANPGSGNVSILLGNGDGTFQSATHVTAATSPFSVAIGDLNGDGRPDLAVANISSNNVSVLIGNGDGTFQNAVHHDAGVFPFSVIAADLNADGRLDLATANLGSHNVAILLNTGSGTFSVPAYGATGASPTSVAAGDFNGDGKADLATANSGASSATVLRNTCPLSDLTIAKSHSGSFAQGEIGRTYSITVTNSGLAPSSGLVTVTEQLPAGLSATAMSGTGWSCVLATVTCTRGDALAAGASYPVITLTVNVANNAAALLTNTVTVSGGGEVNLANNSASDPTTITPSTDLVISLSHAGNFSQGATGRAYTIIARNAGGLATSAPVSVAATVPTGLSATALYGSGWSCSLGALSCTRSDVLAGSTSYPPISLIVNVAPSAPALVTTTASVSGGGEANSSNNNASDPTVIWSSATCGSFGAPSYFAVNSYSISGLVAADFNGDGKQDFATSNYSSQQVSVRLGNGNGTFANAVQYPVGYWGNHIATGDLNNDGKLDLVVVHSASSENISILLGNGDGTFGTATRSSVTQYPHDILLADFNADGNLDVAALHSSGVHVLLGNGNGGLHAPASYQTSPYSARAAAADLDRNGTMDLAATHEGGIAVLSGNGNGTFQPAVNHPITQDPSYLVVADFNHDGNPDLAAGSFYYGVVVLLGNGNGTYQTPVPYSTSYGVTSLAADDLNGDGTTDLVAGDYSGRVSVLYGNGNGTFQTAVAFYVGSDADEVLVSDFNGDGRADLAAANWSSVAILLGGCPDLTITKSHSGTFRGGKEGTYALRVRNVGDGASRGTITVTDILPAGLTATDMYGYPWNCNLPTLTCTSDNSLLNNTEYNQITVVVTVATNAPTSVTNTATVSGGGDTNSANNTATDPTTIVHAPDLTIRKSHVGNFAAGGSGTYTIVVGNVGTAATSGQVMVVDSLPPGMSAASMSGPGWNCSGSATCTRSDVLGPTASYPPITLTVNIASNAFFSLTNTATVSGGGDASSSNNFTSDITTIVGAPSNLLASALTTSQINLTWSTVPSATTYEVLRSSNNGTLTVVGTTLSNFYYDTNVQPNTTYVYRVRAADSAATGPLSVPDVATTFTFTDDPIVTGVTPLRGIHVNEVRHAINLLRAAAGLAPLSPELVTAGASITAARIAQLQVGLNQARSSIGLPPANNPTVGTGLHVLASHIRELRNGVK